MRALTRALWAALLAAVAASAAAQDAPVTLPVHQDGRTETLDIVVDADNLSLTGPVWWRGQWSRTGSAYVRFHIAAPEGAIVDGAALRIRGLGDDILHIPLHGIGPEGRWTRLIMGGAAFFELVAPQRPTALTLRIDKVTYEAETGALYSIVGPDDLTPINDAAVPKRLATLGAPVAKLVFQRDGRPGSCTGFLVDETTLLTNEHCIATAQHCASLTAIFGYERDGDGRLHFGEQFECDAFDPRMVNFELDVALIPLADAPGRRFGFIPLSDADIDDALPLTVIQHPGGDPKQVSIIDCAVGVRVVDGRGAETDFSHRCDTATGSSGAPVLDAQDRLVGLHHYGFADGQVGDWTENRAVRMKLIRSWVASVRTAAADRPD